MGAQTAAENGIDHFEVSVRSFWGRQIVVKHQRLLHLEFRSSAFISGNKMSRSAPFDRRVPRVRDPQTFRVSIRGRKLVDSVSREAKADAEADCEDANAITGRVHGRCFYFRLSVYREIERAGRTHCPR